MGHASEMSSRIKSNRSLANKYVQRKRALRYDRMTKFNTDHTSIHISKVSKESPEWNLYKQKIQRQLKFQKQINLLVLIAILLLSILILN